MLCGMWDLPGPGLEPLSLALAGRFLTTVPPGNPHPLLLSGPFFPLLLLSLSCSIWILLLSVSSQSGSLLWKRALICLFVLKILFLMWTIFKVFIDFVTILLLVYVFWFLVFWPRGMWDLSSQTRD